MGIKENENVVSLKVFNNSAKHYKGCFLMNTYDSLLKQIKDLQVYDSDVFVTSFPKSGTTWTQEMVWLIANDLNYDGAKDSLKARFPFLEVTALFDQVCSEVGENNCIPAFLKNSVEYIKNFKNKPRCIKTHLPWNLLPYDIQMKVKRPKIIHVVRNPKDVCVSYYYHHRTLFNSTETLDEFSQSFLTGKLLYCSYWDNVFSYWEQRNEPNVLFLQYEDMKKDLKSVIIKVAKFLDKKLNDDEIDELMEHLSFDSMRKNDAVNNRKVFNPEKKNKFPFIRQGIVGGYKNEMSSEMIKNFDEWIMENNKGLLYANF